TSRRQPYGVGREASCRQEKVTVTALFVLFFVSLYQMEPIHVGLSFHSSKAVLMTRPYGVASGF
ncbi:MAG: hypothetical protein Q3X12_01845, partial [Hallella sp.]|nr:hypothetical protein [Hallella sp.]